MKAFEGFQTVWMLHWGDTIAYTGRILGDISTRGRTVLEAVFESNIY